MAVRDGQPLNEARRGLPWRETLGHAPAVALVSGLLLYAYLSLCYHLFYGRLGVDPNDVGLSYTGTLARSAGFVTATLVAIVGAVSLVREARREDAEGKTRRERWFPPVGCTVVIACGMVLYLGLILPPLGAWMAGNAVMAGRPVSPTVAADPVLPLPILAIHADPATVEPAGKSTDSPSIERLHGRRLLYLGQSGGIVVLYDATADRAVYVPASSIVLQVANCRAKPPPDAACQLEYKAPG
jgi:amino acid transporter